jgi:hypothetical protein
MSVMLVSSTAAPALAARTAASVPPEELPSVGYLAITHEELVLGAQRGSRTGYASLEDAIKALQPKTEGWKNPAVAITHGVEKNADRFYVSQLMTRSFDPSLGKHGRYFLEPTDLEGHDADFLKSVELDPKAVAAVVDGQVVIK